MLEKHITVGNRVELQAIQRMSRNAEERKAYQSRIHDIISDDKIEVTMPFEKTKLVLLPVGGEFEIVFYASNGLLQCFGKIVDRYKNNNVYILVIDITSNLKKHQRREYYRYNCSIEMLNRVLQEEEITALKEKQKLQELESVEDLYQPSIMVDISGGGSRFVCDQEYNPASIIWCKFKLPIVDKIKEYKVLGKVLFKRKVDNTGKKFEHRVQFIGLSKDAREEIIKFIFEEERKNRKREQGL